jgi:undecaprenyl pyrophosphate synthase
MDLKDIGTFILQLGSTGILILLAVGAWRWGKPWAERMLEGHLTLMDKLGNTLESLDKAQTELATAQKQAAADTRRHSDGMRGLTECQQAILAATNETNRLLGENGRKCKFDDERMQKIHDAVIWMREHGKLPPEA